MMPPAAAVGLQRSKETLPRLSIRARDDVVVRLSVGTGQEMLTPSDLLSLFYAYLNSMYFRFISPFLFLFLSSSMTACDPTLMI